MDTSDREIRFDAGGVCNHCRRFDATARSRPSPAHREQRLHALAERAREDGRGKPYDCVIGLSGGVDSSFAAYQVAALGLRPLAVHFDNGWNSEIAVRNIEQILRRAEIDLHTHVVDWDEFKDLQRSFLEASVVDVELLTDHAITALLYATAAAHGLRWILTGINHATEFVMPRTWAHRKSDARNIVGIHRRFGSRPLKTFPLASTVRIQAYEHVQRIRSVALLDLVDYDKQAALVTLQRELGWTPYGGKHHESIWTRFFQAFILPTKFGIDKRRAHLSSLILSGQLTRAEAERQLAEPIYDRTLLRDDRAYVLKKLELTDAELDAIMAAPRRSHLDYPSDEMFLLPLLRARKLLQRARQSRA